MKRLGEILEGTFGPGANQINGLGFSVSNAETLMDDARKLAIANARRRAELYAAAAGAQLGHGHHLRAPPLDPDGARGRGRARAHAAGTRTLMADANMSYALR